MARKAIPRALRRQVRDRAGDRCEYCRHPAAFSCAPFVCEHVLPRVQGSGNTLAELAWSCAACNGGGVTTCAPGSRPGAEFWVGCCTHPDTGKTYLIAYYDCCGAPSCSNAFCGEPDMQAIMYNPVSGSNDQEIIWCVSDESQSYTCTMAPIIGEDCQTRPAARPKVGAGS